MGTPSEKTQNIILSEEILSIFKMFFVRGLVFSRDPGTIGQPTATFKFGFDKGTKWYTSHL